MIVQIIGGLIVLAAFAYVCAIAWLAITEPLPLDPYSDHGWSAPHATQCGVHSLRGCDCTGEGGDHYR
jgi:hypothetical protein